MNCEKIQIDLSAYLDGELSDTRVIEVELHLNTCSDCQELLQLLDSTRTVFREIKPGKVSAGFQQGVKDAFNETGSGPAQQWLRWAVPMALAASLAVLFFWNDSAVVSVRPSGPMSGPEIYEQMATMGMPGAGSLMAGETTEIIFDDLPGMNPVLRGVDPDNSIPGMGNYYHQMPGSSS